MAKAWYEKSAQQGNQDAQFELAKFFYGGHNDIKAQHENQIKLFLILANNNYNPSQCQLIIIYNDQQTKEGYKNAIKGGKTYTKGKVVPHNYEAAFKWYKKDKFKQIQIMPLNTQ